MNHFNKTKLSILVSVVLLSLLIMWLVSKDEVVEEREVIEQEEIRTDNNIAEVETPKTEDEVNSGDLNLFKSNDEIVEEFENDTIINLSGKFYMDIKLTNCKQGELVSDDGDSVDCFNKVFFKIYQKSNSKYLQTIQTANIYGISVKNKNKSGDLYDNQPTIIISDFNFDGHKDIMIQTGRSGCYGGFSYDIFLYSPKKNLFLKNNSISKLTIGNCFFDVDTKGKKIIVSGKSGCCYHYTEEYKVDKRNRAYMVKKISYEYSHEDDFTIVTERNLINGTWKTKKEKRKKSDL